MCGSGFGSGGVGSAPLGSGSALSVSEAIQTQVNAIDVSFSTAPLARDSASTLDSLNVANWTVEPRSPYGALVRLVQWAERVNEYTVRLLLDGPLSAPAVYRVTAAVSVADIYGISISPECREADVATFSPARFSPEFVSSAESPADLNNPFLVKDAASSSPPPLGTFQVTPAGDYALERGSSYLRKRVLRRATTMAGEFFHLPNYGFAQPLKGNIKPDLLRKLQALAQQQILREPDVASVLVTARLAEGTSNIVVLDMKVSDRYGRTEELTVPVRLRTSG